MEIHLSSIGTIVSAIYTVKTHGHILVSVALASVTLDTPCTGHGLSPGISIQKTVENHTLVV